MRGSLRHDDERGFTIVEVLVAVTLLLVGVLGTATMMDGANATTGSNLAREAGTNLARQLVEGARAVPYAQLASTGALQASLQTQPGLADSDNTDGVWTIRRRAITYTVTAAVCSVDDELDGYGAHSGGFCADSAAGTTDLNPDDYKRVSVLVTWQRGPRPEQVSQATMIPNPGNAAGPAITAFGTTSTITCNMTVTTCPAITSITLQEVDFDVTTSSPAETVAWAIDGEVQAPESVTGSSTGWDFDWPIADVVDGTYLISAQALGTPAVEGGPAPAGAQRVLTITLNRSAPAAVAGFAAGRSLSPLDQHEIVDMEWLPNPERDIEGYRVYRVVGLPGDGDDVLVCPAAGTTPIKPTTCQDDAPPPGTLQYYAVAVDRDPAGAYREGVLETVKTVLTTNNPPFAPLTPTLVYGSETATVSWVIPTPQDPDVGDSIDFFRIYRDGQGISNRYDRVSGTTTTYTDTSTGGTSHSYWVSAVDTQLGESAPVQAVAP